MVLVGEEARGITGHRVNTYPGHAKDTLHVVYSLWPLLYIGAVLPLGQGGAKGGARSLP